jgi:DNA-binding NarL/FixJ family response regulator
MSVRILIVDDHKLIRQGIAQFLENDEKYVLTGEASEGIEALEFLKSNEVDLVLTDISMPHMDGIELAKNIHSEYPDIKIVGLTIMNDNNHIKKLMNAGAVGYILKNCSESELKKALDKVMDGETYYSPEATETVMNSLMKKKNTISVDMPLTTREKEVLELIVKEFSNQEIADKLFISLRTVDAHKRNLLEKTGAKNIAGLVVYAINHNLVDNY